MWVSRAQSAPTLSVLLGMHTEILSAVWCGSILVIGETVAPSVADEQEDPRVF